MARKLAQESDIIGYWFASEPVLPNGDCRAVVIGEILTVDLPLEMCRRGLHGSEHPFDALLYALGPLLYRCRFSGEILRETDKLCASERTALAMVDLTPQLRLFARQQALSVVHLWDAPPVVRKFLETGEESLRNIAKDAVMAAAWTAHGAAVAGKVTNAARCAAEANAMAAASAAGSTEAVMAARTVVQAAWAASGARAVRAARAAFMRIVDDAFVGHDLP